MFNKNLPDNSPIKNKKKCFLCVVILCFLSHRSSNSSLPKRIEILKCSCCSTILVQFRSGKHCRIKRWKGCLKNVLNNTLWHWNKLNSSYTSQRPKTSVIIRHIDVDFIVHLFILTYWSKERRRRIAFANKRGIAIEFVGEKKTRG